MAELLLFYYITDRTQFAGSELEQREQLLAKVAEAARTGVDYIQLRDKDLSSRKLEELARAILRAIKQSGGRTRLLINSRTDIAIAIGAEGVHLRSNDISPADVRRICRAAGNNTEPVVAVSCHTEAEVQAAKLAGSDFVVFGPVFGKAGAPGIGLDALKRACALGIPVFALGGVTPGNAKSCVEIGAAGVAGIRLFQEGDAARIVKHLCR